MSLTRIDCHVYRGAQASTEGSSFAALNPARVPGSLVVAASTAIRESIGGQVACRLALEHFVDGVLNYFDDDAVNAGDANPDPNSTRSMRSLEIAFKNANSSVYNFGHKLAAGGRMGAALMGVVVVDRMLAAGRVGQSAAYLYRRGEVFPFFERRAFAENAPPGSAASPQPIAAAIGSQSTVAIELASVPIEEDDLLILLPRELTVDAESELADLCADEHDARLIGEHGVGFCRRLCQTLFSDSERLAFGFIAQFGPESIYLARAVA